MWIRVVTVGEKSMSRFFRASYVFGPGFGSASGIWIDKNVLLLLSFGCLNDSGFFKGFLSLARSIDDLDRLTLF